jgi:hypothetical protein
MAGYFIGFTIYMCKTKCKLYKRTGFLIISYFVLFLCRLIVNTNRTFFGGDRDTLTTVVRSVELAIFNTNWVALYIMVFHIHETKLKLKAKDVSDYHKTLQRRKLIEATVLWIYIVG